MKPPINDIILLVMINLVLVVAGFFVVRQKAILIAWLLFGVSITAVFLIFRSEHPVIKMLAIIAVTFTAMKLVVVPLEYAGKHFNLFFKQWLMFACGWAGMRARPFATLGGKALPGAGRMIWFGASRLVLGVLLILRAHGLVRLQLNAEIIRVIVSVILLTGLSLILHFGVLSISAGMWRLSGANTYLLFRQPTRALSLTEFWGKRWNLAFSEMTAISIFRPLRNKLGKPAAFMIAFIFSGILHELALSLPVNSGYGLPTLYFILQGLLVLLEKWLNARHRNFLANKLVAKVWLFFWLVLPAPLLFHTQFIKQIVWPLAGLKFL